MRYLSSAIGYQVRHIEINVFMHGVEEMTGWEVWSKFWQLQSHKNESVAENVIGHLHEDLTLQRPTARVARD